MGAKNGRDMPPVGLDFWGLMDHFWALGIGNAPHADGTPQPWTAEKLEQAFDGTPDKRSIENWRSHSFKPSPENIRKLSWVIAAGNDDLRRAWYDALIAARQNQIRQERTEAKSSEEPASDDRSWRRPALLVTAAMAFGIAIWAWFKPTHNSDLVQNIRICDQFYFDQETKECTQHVSVFMEGIDEVFLSFDFAADTAGLPFERWWILNGERVAGRTSFNDAAWPGYTFWRPGVLNVGQYVVRIVMADQTFTQTFQVQQEGYISQP